MLNPITLTLSISGIATSIASGIGTHAYILREFQDGLMAVIGSSVLAIIVFFAWHACFSSKKWTLKLLALAIALPTTALSSWTIYENSLLLQQQASQAHQKTQQSKSEQITNARIETLKEQQAANNQSIQALKDQNKTDQKTAHALQKNINKGIRPKANSKALKALIDLMQQRTKEIAALNITNANLTDRIDQALASKAAVKTTSENNANIKYSVLARASFYDVSTALLLLLSGIFATNKRDKENKKFSELKSQAEAATKELKATIKSANKAYVRTNKAYVHPNARTFDVHMDVQMDAKDVQTDKPQPQDEKLTKDEALELIKTQKMPLDEDGLISLKTIMENTGLGRRIATTVRDEAINKQYAYEIKRGKGISLSYQAPQPELDLPHNIVPLTMIRSA